MTSDMALGHTQTYNLSINIFIQRGVEYRAWPTQGLDWAINKGSQK